MTTVERSISVVIPCFNAAPFLRETLDSVLKQTCPPLEVVLVDDGSTDGSGNIAQSYGSPVRVIRQVNQGESVARNRGMDEARGDWIALLDADDRWVPHKLERQIAAINDGPSDVVCVYSDMILFGSVKRRVWPRPPWPVKSEYRVRMLTDPWIAPGSALVRRAEACQVRFPSDIIHGEDQVFWMQLSDLGSFLYVPEPLLEYRKHAHQQTSQNGHGFRVAVALWSWATKHREAFNETEYELARLRFAEIVRNRHDDAFWANDWDVVAKARPMYREILPDAESLPPLFHRDPPGWSIRTAHAVWNSLLDILPEKARITLWRAARRPIEIVKRGRLTS